MTTKTTPINYHSVKYYKALLQRPFDGSNANKHSRNNARAYLGETINVFTEFANKNPESKPANYLKGLVNHLQEVIDISIFDETPVKES